MDTGPTTPSTRPAVTLPHLEPAPESLVDHLGLPRFGAYSGRIARASLEGLGQRYRRDRVTRLLTEKKWHYGGFASPSLVVGGVIIQLGYLASAFVYVFDRLEKRMALSRSFILPSPLVQVGDEPTAMKASMRRVRSRMSIDAGVSEGRFFAELSGGGRIDLRLDVTQAASPLSLVCPIGEQGMNLTQKTSGVLANGEVRIGSRTYRLSGAIGGLDYTHGFLARDTRWSWASAHGRLANGKPVGLNLTAGFNDDGGGQASENVIWLDGEPHPVGPATFAYDPRDALKPWRITTADGRVELDFLPEGVRAEDTDLKVVVSQYAQPIGTFSGKVLNARGDIVRLEKVPGVTEWHRARW